MGIMGGWFLAPNRTEWHHGIHGFSGTKWNHGSHCPEEAEPRQGTGEWGTPRSLEEALGAFLSFWVKMLHGNSPRISQRIPPR